MANELQLLSLILQTRLFLTPNHQGGHTWLQQQLVGLWEGFVKSPAKPVSLYGPFVIEATKE